MASANEGYHPSRDYVVLYQCPHCGQDDFAAFTVMTRSRPSRSYTCTGCGWRTKARAAFLMTSVELARSWSAFYSYHRTNDRDPETLDDLDVFRTSRFPLDLVPFGTVDPSIALLLSVDVDLGGDIIGQRALLLALLGR